MIRKTGHCFCLFFFVGARDPKIRCLIRWKWTNSNGNKIFSFFFLLCCTFSIFVPIFSCQNAVASRVSFKVGAVFDLPQLFLKRYIPVISISNCHGGKQLGFCFLFFLESRTYCSCLELISMGTFLCLKSCRQSHFYNSNKNRRNVKEEKKKSITRVAPKLKCAAKCQLRHHLLQWNMGNHSLNIMLRHQLTMPRWHLIGNSSRTVLSKQWSQEIKPSHY